MLKKQLEELISVLKKGDLVDALKSSGIWDSLPKSSLKRSHLVTVALKTIANGGRGTLTGKSTLLRPLSQQIGACVRVKEHVTEFFRRAHRYPIPTISCNSSCLYIC